MSEIDFIVAVEADSKLVVAQTMLVFPFRGDVIGLGQIQELKLFAKFRSKRFETEDTRKLQFEDEPTAEAMSVAVCPVDPDEPPGKLHRRRDAKLARLVGEYRGVHRTIDDLPLWGHPLQVD
jgi:hypothetical protein